MACLLVEQRLSRADDLEAEFQQGGETRYIDEAIMLNREALDICTPGHVQRPDCFIALSHSTWTRYQRLGGLENLDETTRFD